MVVRLICARSGGEGAGWPLAVRDLPTKTGNSWRPPAALSMSCSFRQADKHDVFAQKRKSKEEASHKHGLFFFPCFLPRTSVATACHVMASVEAALAGTVEAVGGRLWRGAAPKSGGRLATQAKRPRHPGEPAQPGSSILWSRPKNRHTGRRTGNTGLQALTGCMHKAYADIASSGRGAARRRHLQLQGPGPRFAIASR
ncbi:hypothetical protein GGTG_10476 [Gaeumannomyces tritici R3-111a-1]|uniref:Uncharacterized protein n=1 Tax=Gaeumannomyces tritici (strain R3-111a-1) TaxID=644352 RepID=J3PAF0_GAET3|nr:hypothetical protein GGTG_10476 [Gaeumannomyces tritici R3-111a-1]EJT71216.1 hypothetical protein GGTG_10476 [Gaeumannomyces tritici R3-111a-1]